MTRRRIVLTAAVLAAFAAVGVGVAWDRFRIEPGPLNAAETAKVPASRT